jgi:hypothetical protein
VLAAAMLNSNANSAKLFSPVTTYSPPTCHSALQAARNKQQQNGANFEIGSGVRPQDKFSNGNFVSELSGRFEKTSLNNNNVDCDDRNNDVGDGESTRKLGRTWSVGRLVNNFESPSLPSTTSTENPPAHSNLVRDFRSPKLSVPSLSLSNGATKPFLAPKPPSLIGVVKPMLRHTVSTLCT